MNPPPSFQFTFGSSTAPPTSETRDHRDIEITKLRTALEEANSENDKCWAEVEEADKKVEEQAQEIAKLKDQMEILTAQKQQLEERLAAAPRSRDSNTVSARSPSQPFGPMYSKSQRDHFANARVTHATAAKDREISALRSQNAKDAKEYREKLKSIQAETEQVVENLRHQHDSEKKEWANRLQAMEIENNEVIQKLREESFKEAQVCSDGLRAKVAEVQSLKNEIEMYFVAGKGLEAAGAKRELENNQLTSELRRCHAEVERLRVALREQDILCETQRKGLATQAEQLSREKARNKARKEAEELEAEKKQLESLFEALAIPIDCTHPIQAAIEFISRLYNTLKTASSESALDIDPSRLDLYIMESCHAIRLQKKKIEEHEIQIRNLQSAVESNMAPEAQVAGIQDKQLGVEREKEVFVPNRSYGFSYSDDEEDGPSVYEVSEIKETVSVHLTRKLANPTARATPTVENTAVVPTPQLRHNEDILATHQVQHLPPRDGSNYLFKAGLLFVFLFYLTSLVVEIFGGNLNAYLFSLLCTFEEEIRTFILPFGSIGVLYLALSLAIWLKQ